MVDPDTGAVYAPVAYVEQMEQAYAAADLMLGRCGAGTVMETAAVGLPAVFVPYPHGNGEQARNAALVVEAGGGLLLPDDRLHAGAGWRPRSRRCSATPSGGGEWPRPWPVLPRPTPRPCWRRELWR